MAVQLVSGNGCVGGHSGLLKMRGRTERKDERKEGEEGRRGRRMRERKKTEGRGFIDGSLSSSRCEVRAQQLHGASQGADDIIGLERGRVSLHPTARHDT